jgi:hypothetical protein
VICSIETGWIALLIFALALINSISHMTLCAATDLITQELKLSLIKPKYSFVLWKFPTISSYKVSGAGSRP